MAQAYQTSAAPDPSKLLDLDDRYYFDKRRGSMRTERETFIPHYKELAQFVRPRRGRWFIDDRNKGGSRYSSIINSKATQAHGICQSGLLAGTMSPARPWFALSTGDQSLDEYQPVKEWLYHVANTMRAIFNASNLYDMAPQVIGELLLFGTGCMTQDDDFDDVSRFYCHTAGSYMIDQGPKFKVDTLVREYEWTCRQIVHEFGLKNVSVGVKNAWNCGNYEMWFPLVTFIEPNPHFIPGNPFNKQFRSVTYEPGCTDGDKYKFLEQKGYYEFPAYVPRWSTTGEDIYGVDCPAMTALGDIKGLQIEERRKAQGIDKMVAPPLTGPASLRNVPINALPNGTTLYEGDQSDSRGLRPLYQIQLRLDELRLDMKEVEGRIDSAFFVELFKPITNMPGIQPKNQFELSQRTQEAMLLVGPVLERIHSDWLSRMIDRTFARMARVGLLPPAPPELHGRSLKVDYISPLAMAQKQTVLGGIERLASLVGTFAEQGDTSMKYKFDSHAALEEYADALGTPPRLLRPEDEVKQQVAADEQKRAMAQNIAAAQSMAKTGKDGAQAFGTALDAIGGQGPQQ